MTTLTKQPPLRTEPQTVSQPQAAAVVPFHQPFVHPSSLVHPTPADVLDLQRLTGNRSVQRLLVLRDPNTTVLAPPTPLLSNAQVVRAISFYRSQPARYTPDIIKQIQAAVGTVPTGTITEVDVQAVAKKQTELNVNARPALKVDGMAGPRTLPSIFKIGLAKDDTLSSYTTESAKLWKDKTKTEPEIAKQLVDTLLNDRLAALDAPPVKFKIVHDLGDRGVFSPKDWELQLDDLQFQPGPKHDLKQTTSTIYHEGRHAEQNFKVAQMLAGKKRTVDQIIVETGINPDVAKKAVLKPLARGAMEAVIAEGWHDSLNSAAGREKEGRVSAELDAATKAREKAQKDFDADPSPANRAKLDQAKARRAKAVAEHDDLPHEFDAERLETRVEQEFDKAP